MFRVLGSGLRVEGSGFRVQGSGFRVEHATRPAEVLGLRVLGVRFGAWGLGCRISDREIVLLFSK